MPITTTELEVHLSGGGGNSDPNASLAGIISTTILVDATLNNLFDDVSGSESNAGDVEYRHVYVKNADPSLTAQTPRVYISQDSTGTGDEIDIALGNAANGATETAIANESTAPSPTLTFTHPTTYGSGLAPSNVTFGSYFSLWVKRTVQAAGAAKNNNTAIFNVDVDTAE
jgi:hypothetical protein